jgi:hypothetical protein
MKASVALGGAILACFMAATYGLMSWACGLFMGQKMANLLTVAERYDSIGLSPLWAPLAEGLPAASATIPGPQVWSGYILAVMLLLNSAILISYVQSAYASGLSLIYVILRKKKDDENMLEWEDDTLMDTSFDEPAASAEEPADTDEASAESKNEGEASDTPSSES